ncbi:MAG: glycosyltransferase family 4 protein, partial [Acidobacteria bacterium]|nr:glycosyltransferase family 4 protein [Acidobacteriota bacterium]
ENAAPYYAAADIYVHPTYYDPCSLVVLEALASGLPVVTSRFNGAGELLTPGVEGDLIDDPGDAQALCRCLEPMLETPRRRMMGAAARKLALAHTFERNCDEIVAMYEEIVAQRRAA